MPAKSPESTATVAPWTHLLAVCAAGILLYANTFDAPFVFDDSINITHNPYIRVEGLDLAGLKSAAFESRAPRPLAFPCAPSGSTRSVFQSGAAD